MNVDAVATRSIQCMIIWVVVGCLVSIHAVSGAKSEAAGESDLSQRHLSRDNLLVYNSAEGQQQPVRNIEDWRIRRRQILDGMQSVMGELPGDKKRCSLEVETESEVDCGSYVRRLIFYRSEPNCRVPAYLLIPKAALQQTDRKFAAILCLHETDKKVGHGVIISGIAGSGKHPYASELAERGYVVVAPNYPLPAEYQPDLNELQWQSGTLKAVWDNIRGIDLLTALPFVAANKIGVIGHSLGGHNGVFTAAFDERIQVIVSSCGFDSFLDYLIHKPSAWDAGTHWAQPRYMPRMAAYRGRLKDIPFDFHEVVAALAPRRVLIIAPLRDGNFQASSVDRIAAAARPIFSLYGQSDRLEVEHPDNPHEFSEAMREVAYQLFDEAFR
jgi:dienelactone hydrolase